MAATLMKTIYEEMRKAIERNPAQLKGLNREQILEAIMKVTEALDELPETTSIHSVLFAVTYVRNGVLVAMDDNAKRMESTEGGTQ